MTFTTSSRHVWEEHKRYNQTPKAQRLLLKHQLYPTFHLEPKLVEEVVDEVFDKADDADVQVLASDVVEDDSGRWRRQFVPQSEVLLVAVNGHLKGQKSQHQKVVLHTNV